MCEKRPKKTISNQISHVKALETFKCDEKPLGFMQVSDIMDLYLKRARLVSAQIIQLNKE